VGAENSFGDGEMENRKPYVDTKIDDCSWIRTFDPQVAENDEYVWHRDYEDRIVEVLEGCNWKFQFDNQLPFLINKGDVLHIQKMIYHRIIPSEEKLTIKITEVG
jgi:hypothetical protein